MIFVAKITKITVQQKVKDLYNIFLDKGEGEEYAFSVSETVLAKFQLRKGMEMDEFAIVEVEYEEQIQKAYQASLHFLAIRMRSMLEVRTFLEKKEIEEPIIQEVLHRLSEQNYINDRDFALAYVRTQMKTTEKGKELVLRELKEKGINDSICEEVLVEYKDEVELEKGKKLLQKYFAKNKRDSLRLLKQKGEQYLRRKGYSFTTIQQILGESGIEDEGEEWEALLYQGEKAKRKYKKYVGYEYEQKMKNFLYRKGFSLELIEKYLAFIKENE